MFIKKQPSTPGRVRPPILTERSNASVFSYHANRSASQTPITRYSDKGPHNTGPNVAKKVRQASRIVVLCCVAVALLLNLIVSHRPKLLTANKAAPGQLFLQSEDVYAEAAGRILQASPLYRTKLTIDTKAIARKLTTQYPELEHVVISVPLIGSQPVFYLEPASPALLLATQAGEVYVVDSNGKALALFTGTSAVSKLNLPTVTDESGLPVTLGAIALPGTNVTFIKEVTGQLKAKRIGIHSLTLPAGASELQVRISGAAYVVRYNLHGDARVGVGTFLAVKQQLERENKTAREYVDVRVDGRAYYK